MYQTSSSLERADRAAGLAARHAGAGAEAVLAAAIGQDFPGRIGLVSSFGTEAAVLLHMVSRIDPYVPVIFLDTWKHFPETLAYRDRLIAAFGLCNIQTVTPRPAALEADDPDGTLHGRDPDRCCHVRKTLPMLAALRSLDCWITGRKRHQASSRADLALFEAQDRWIKLNPLADWTGAETAAYFAAHDLPPHPLAAQGYPSVGCAPCTRAVAEGEDARAGRWAESGKTECGIHIVDGRIVRG
ncbi:phosphoadenylyl-sulfate reductase [Pelagovum pacificum]|uniref:Adenosine 5'-phosphosulfate reductase n=1 Tax=Pelagovum pacificum TaxID=2588711 RepID=A0A5C5G940_9RHOB|nr:phosphoadenylyl-sulfate reductase [Pelagovum pacificum]QQA45096.1 phosphoadenylyl-sulfate reductase [Pelagovum pacificum]TNY30530.1 phosphoadenylyl-sulfate reductase [Pelagovum pacificum]